MLKRKQPSKNKSKKSSKPRLKPRLKSSRTASDFTPLVKGDLIDVVAPGSAADPAVIEKACFILQSWGFKTRVAKDLFSPQLFLSNSDDFRFKSLKSALLAKDSKAVWCVRGGYGSIRLLPLLNKLKKPKKPKLVIGFSDITSIQIFLAQKWNWPSLHGPLLDRIGLESLTPDNLHELKSFIQGQKISEFSNIKPLNSSAENIKSIQGMIIGGNLTVATSTLGTANQIQGQQKILFFEEVSERGYRIDRYLQQLKQAGVFKNAKAVLFGEFTKCTEPDGTDLSFSTLKDFFKELKVPAFYGIELGHGILQRPIFFNTAAKISSVAIDKSQFKVLVWSPYEVFKSRI